MVTRLLTIFVAIASIHPAARVQAPASEQQVQAAYLSQFGRYVEWPAANVAGEPFDVCVLGDDPFGAALDAAVRGKIINGQPMAAKRLAGPRDAQACRVLYVSTSERDRLAAVLKSLNGKSILTVGEGTAFTERGGMIGFVLADKRVRFVVNLGAADAAGVKLSSQLLRLAVDVDR